MGERFEPRPDPAIEDRQRPGLRPHRHPPNVLHAWVFLQHQVWVDYWGNEHEIESMPLDYVENVIGFCLRQAERIRALVALNAALQALGLVLAGERERAQRLIAVAKEACRAPSDVGWLEETPLFNALRRQLAGKPERPDDRSTGKDRA